MSRLATYGTVSTLLAASAVASAWAARGGSFFATCIHLTQSSMLLMILLNFALFVGIIVGRVTQKIFFGQLRTIEVEHLYERSWFSVTETCLAMTLFRDQFDVKYLVFFGFLLMIKIQHWLIIDRVDFVSLWPWFATRLIEGADGTSNQSTDTAIPSQNGNYYDHNAKAKSDCILSDLFKLIAYLCFFGLIMHFYGFPLHIIRDLYMILRSFIQRCKDLIQYHRATRNMNDRYPDATAADLAATDGVCIICREEMTAENAVAGGQQQNQQPNRNAVPKKLACGHIFHMNCLRSWLERQQSCPTCRRSVLDPPPAPPAAAVPAAPAVHAAQHEALIQAMQALLQQQQLQQQQLHQQPQDQLHRQSSYSSLRTDVGNSSIDSQAKDATLKSADSKETPAETSTSSFVPVNVNVPLNTASPSTLQQFRLTRLGPITAAEDTKLLTELTDDELRQLEGRSRESTIARLEELRKIQKQLTGLTVRLAQVVSTMTEASEDAGDVQKEENVSGKGKERAEG
ncbi:E3 ubiquitin-protein ligase hrd1 [Entophlyctis luteolus]|nr:E3 ubiquitin-protein ligase hrd1 [Entophlyctis luteolus]KAJ3212690.1 E3 ubiquitin-protein ligase hrd1 [Entophlyctis luteolus]